MTLNSHFFLKSKRLGFRCWSSKDLPLAMQLWGDQNVTRYIDARGQLNAEQIKEKLEQEIRRQEKYGVQYWPIFLLGNDDFVGCCGLRPYDISNNILEIGFHIAHRHWRKGYASEAAHTVISHTFSTLQSTALFAGHNPHNTASATLLRELGFAYTHDEYYAPTGLNHPSYILER